jgi:hypothetical protein
MLIANFKSYLGSFDRYCPFIRYGQLEYHVETIERRQKLGSASAAIEDETFQRALYRTLQAWGIGSRASQLRSLPEFVAALHAKAEIINALDKLKIDDPALDVEGVGDILAETVQSLAIVDNKARTVPGSKALHHILPDLVVPIDRAYTQQFFLWANPTFQNYPTRCFKEAFAAFTRIARDAHPRQYVREGGWYTSQTKVIDNAIVGLWCEIKARVRSASSRQSE